MYLLIILINIISLFLYIHISYSADSIIYADKIETDKYQNVIAKGNVKIINVDEILTTNELYIDEQKSKIYLNDDFSYKDKKGNYYFGSKGEFTKDFYEGEIYNFSYYGKDNLRLVGKKSKKIGNIDIIEKGVVTPCRTLKLFGCPLWQIKAKKLIHDKDDLLVYQKHSRTEIMNFPVFYTPYSVTPSPLRKIRRSGFLYPTFQPFNSSHGGSAKIPYYFNISRDKELLLTPTIYYLNNTQNIKYDYGQRISGGKVKAQATTSTDFKEQDKFDWLTDAYLNLTVNQKINRNFESGLNLNFQTSGTYLRSYDPQNKINLLSSLSSKTYVDGYSVFETGDLLTIETYNFQAVKTDINRKKIPIVSPVVNYNSSTKWLNNNINFQNKFLFYHIFRDKNTPDHAYRQTRLNYDAHISYQKFIDNSRLKFESILQTDAYSTYKKQIGNEFISEEHYRIFPMTGVFIDKPYSNNKGTIYTPQFFLAINGSNNNTNEISNEITTDNEFNLSRFFSVNRYTGNDKFDNGQRIGYGLGIKKKNFKFNIAQGFQISSDSDYTKDVNMDDDLSDVLGYTSLANILGSSVNFSYDYRYNPSHQLLYYQSAGISGDSAIGSYSISYHNSDDRSSSLSFGQRESISLSYNFKSFIEYNSLSFSTSYDLHKNSHQASTIVYGYSDECFSLSAIYNRNFFEKMPDTLTLSMSLKFIGPVPAGIIDDFVLVPLNFKEKEE